MKASKDTILTLATFFPLVAVFYVLGYWLIYRMGQATPLMLSVGCATVLTCVIRKRSLASLGWGWGEWKYQWMSYLIPFFIAFSAYAIIWTFGFADFYNADFLLKQKEKYNLATWSEMGIFIFHFLLVASISRVGWARFCAHAHQQCLHTQNNAKRQREFSLLRVAQINNVPGCDEKIDLSGTWRDWD